MSIEFEAKLVKWGPSLGVVIPKPIRNGMKLAAGDTVRIIVKDNMICMQKIEEI